MNEKNFAPQETSPESDGLEEKKQGIEVIPEAADDINSLAQKMVSAWRPEGNKKDSVVSAGFVHARFEGVDLIIGGGDTPEDVVEKFNRAKQEKE